MVSKSSVIGIDLGASDSLVAYVGKGIVDLVQNEVSKRATSSIVGFTDRERLLGDSALAQIRSNAKNSCRNFKHLLGRPVDAPDLDKEHFWSTSKLAAAEDGMAGYDVTYKGEPRVFSSVPVTAMFLTQLKEITEKWCQAKVADAVISVPSFFSDVQRQAVLDAAKVAGISVLRLMNEHTATALAYGIYRSNDFDAEKPMTVAFCSMGHSIFSVSIVQFVKGKLTVVCERSDKVGGRDMDECLMREFSAQFEKKFGCDPLSSKKSLFKLEDAVTKTKKILSANSEAGLSVECLMEDNDFQSNMVRADFERMCAPMMDKVKAVLESAKTASGMTVDQIDSVEVVGGASRVPWFKAMCSEAFGGKELATTMNADESVARGCALQAAILSPLYKVREFKVEDTSMNAVNVGWTGTSTDAEAPKEDDADGDIAMAGGDGDYKTTTVFPSGSLTGIQKMLTFFRKQPFDVKAEFAEDARLLPSTSKELGSYKIELPPQTENKKIKVKAQLTLHGTFLLHGAQMIETEEYEETVKEKRELPAEASEAEVKPAADATMKTEGESEAEVADAAMKTDGETAEPMKTDGDTADVPMTDGEEKPAEAEEKKEEPKKEPEKKYEWVDVVKTKKRTKRTDLKISVTGAPGLPEAAVSQLLDAETAMQSEMREIIETDEKRNDLEGYIFTMRDKISESGKYGAFVSTKDREQFSSDLEKAENWLYDFEGATKAQYIEKLDELKEFGHPIEWRFKEDSIREEWLQALTGTIQNYRAAAENPGDKYGHIAAEQLAKICAACNDLESWLSEKKAEQGKLPKTEKPVLVCADMEKKNQELAKVADEILKEPKPAPPKEEKKEEEKKEGAEEAAPKEEAAEPSPATEGEGDGPQNMDVD
jgi:molecular chaperone DnaK (HSP70)